MEDEAPGARPPEEPPRPSDDARPTVPFARAFSQGHPDAPGTGQGPEGTLPLPRTAGGAPAVPRRPPVLDPEATPDHAELRAVDPQDYAIGPEMARGGMGRILVARDRRHGRPVAIKELLQLDRDHRRRFHREAMTTARLQHPSIVNIYEAGEWPSGEPFYAMKLVKGRSLARVLGEARTFEERLALLPAVLAVVDALAYAHRQRVIHRDLKPDNVLVGEFGETVVIDWGLAKDLAAPGDDPAATPTAHNLMLQGAGLTQAGDIVGTPTNMPPEQARGAVVDERADVYALGSILYEVLCGKPPYGGTNAVQVLIQVVKAPPPPVQEREPRVPPDLAAIVAKAMARQPGDRYPTAAELAEELRRFQTGQLVAAHAYRPAELVRRWVRRHRTALTLAAVFAVVLAAVGAASIWQIVQARRLAEAAQHRAEVERDRAGEATRREAARADELTLAQARVELGRDPRAALALLGKLSPGFARWGAARLIAADAAAAGVPRAFVGHHGTVTALAFSPDGSVLATASKDRTVRLWNLGSGESRTVARHDHWAWFVTFAPDGRSVASAGRDMALRVAALDGTPRHVLRHPGMVWDAAFAPDGGSIATACFDGNVRVWDLATGSARVLEGHRDRVQQVAFSPDGTTLASASDDRAVRLWDLRSGAARVLAGHAAPVWRVRFQPRVGGGLASCDVAGKVLLWDLVSGRPQAVATHEGGARDLAWSPDGATLASCGRDGLVRLIAVAPEPREERVLRGHGDAVRHVAFSPDGKLLASAAIDNSVRLWDLESGEARVLYGHEDSAPPVFAPNGASIASAAADATVRLHDVDTGARVLRGDGAPLRGLSLGGRRLASYGADGTLWMWDLDVTAETGSRFSWRDPGLASVALTQDGGRLAAAGETLRLWDLATEEGEPIVLATGPFTSAAFSRDGAMLVAGAADGRLVTASLGPSPETRTMDTGAGVPTVAAGGTRIGWGGLDGRAGVVGPGGQRRGLSPHLDMVTALAWSADEAWLATGSHDTTACLARADGSADIALRGHDAAIWALALAPGRVATASGDRTIGLWDLAGRAERRLEGHTDWVVDLALSPEGARLASASRDRTVRIWDLASGESRRLVAGGEITKVAFAEDGRAVVAASLDGTVRWWPDALPLEPAALRAWIEAHGGAAAPGGR